jgi:hypothetical protein
MSRQGPRIRRPIRSHQTRRRGEGRWRRREVDRTAKGRGRGSRIREGCEPVARHVHGGPKASEIDRRQISLQSGGEVVCMASEALLHVVHKHACMAGVVGAGKVAGVIITTDSLAIVAALAGAIKVVVAHIDVRDAEASCRVVVDVVGVYGAVVVLADDILAASLADGVLTVSLFTDGILAVSVFADSILAMSLVADGLQAVAFQALGARTLGVQAPRVDAVIVRAARVGGRCLWVGQVRRRLGLGVAEVERRTGGRGGFRSHLGVALRLCGHEQSVCLRTLWTGRRR